MRYFGVILFFLMVTSCNHFNVKKTSFEAILDEELQTFNWKDVDQYPTFLKCQSVSAKQESKTCFQKELAQYISDFLEQKNIIVSKDLNDTVFLNLKVSRTGYLKLINVRTDTSIVNTIPRIRYFLNSSIDSLPKIYPAIKRGQSVNIEFVLPIVVNTD